jgi:hypothetical protein
VSPLALVPTAAHAVFELHATPLREREANGEVGGWIDHLDPFQRSASSIASPPESRKDSPTATHAVLEVHETPENVS